MAVLVIVVVTILAAVLVLGPVPAAALLADGAEAEGELDPQPASTTATATAPTKIKPRFMTSLFVLQTHPSFMDTTPQRGRHPFLQRLDNLTPYWEPQLVVLLAIVLDLWLPQRVTVGPRWLLPALEGALLIALVILAPNMRPHHAHWRRRLALGLIGVVSATNIFSLVELCRLLVHGHPENGRALIGGGIVLWCTNVLLFGLWYWELDRGGPLARRQREDDQPDFMFVQHSNPEVASPGWEPGMIDYLYLSFTNATAFSPTDTMPLTPIAKILMAAQSLAALLTVGLVVARAVNILPAGS